MPINSAPPAEAVIPDEFSGGYYRHDFRRLTFAEGWRLTRSLKVIGRWSRKLFGTGVRSAGVFPAPRPMIESLVGRDALSKEALREFDQVRWECEPLGFGEPFYYSRQDILALIESAVCVLRQSSGETVVQAAYTRAASLKNFERARLGFHTGLLDGRMLMTTDRTRKFEEPPGDLAAYFPRATPAELYAEHRRRIDEHRAARNPPVPALTFEEISRMFYDDARRGYEFNVARGLYVPLTEEEVARATSRWAIGLRALKSCSPAALEEVRTVLAALDQREDTVGSASTAKAILLLGISLAAFAALSRLRSWSWEFIAVIAGVLLIHEAGHFLAMRAFGYRNVRMFFIPFFGAAVSGLKTRAPSWQKALVALAGPVPGVFAGAALFWSVRVHLATGSLAREVAAVLLVVNAFNLLPLLPFDGGRVVDEILFRRHPQARAIFAGAAAVGLAVLAFNYQPILYGTLAFFVWAAACSAMRTHSVLRRLRAEGVALTEPATTPGGDEPIRMETLPALLAALKDGRQTTPTRRLLTAEALAVIDQARARPPGAAATVGLLALYGAACAVAISILLPIFSPRLWNHRESRARIQQRVETSPDGGGSEADDGNDDTPAPRDSPADKSWK